jgi:hypothetical protein
VDTLRRHCCLAHFDVNLYATVTSQPHHFLCRSMRGCLLGVELRYAQIGVLRSRRSVKSLVFVHLVFKLDGGYEENDAGGETSCPAKGNADRAVWGANPCS